MFAIPANKLTVLMLGRLLLQKHQWGLCTPRLKSARLSSIQKVISGNVTVTNSVSRLPSRNVCKVTFPFKARYPYWLVAVTRDSYTHTNLCFSTDTLSNSGFTDTVAKPWSSYLWASDEETEAVLSRDVTIVSDFISEEEEQSLFDEVEPYFKTMRYEYDHWDNAIHGFRETERRHWGENNSAILQRVQNVAFPPKVQPMSQVHVLDLSKDGYIKPHVDAVRYCGNTIAGMCLLSSAVMRLVHVKNKDRFGDVLLSRRCLYIMKNSARYDYTHEVLENSKSKFADQVVPRDRRISVICRNEPDPKAT